MKKTIFPFTGEQPNDVCHSMFKSLTNKEPGKVFKDLGWVPKYKIKTAEIEELEARMIQLKSDRDKLKGQIDALKSYLIISAPGRVDLRSGSRGRQILRKFGEAAGQRILQEYSTRKLRAHANELDRKRSELMRRNNQTQEKLVKAKRDLELIKDEIRKIRAEAAKYKCDTIITHDAWRFPFI